MRLKFTLNIRVGAGTRVVETEIEQKGTVEETVKLVKSMVARKYLLPLDRVSVLHVFNAETNVKIVEPKLRVTKQEYLESMARNAPEKYREYLNKQIKVCEIQGRTKSSGKAGSISRRKGE